MSIEKTNRILVIALIAMVMLNVLTLGVLWSKNGPEKREQIRKYRVERQRGDKSQDKYKKPDWVNTLELNEEQEAFYTQERKAHKEEIRIIRDSIRKNKMLIHEELHKFNPDEQYISDISDSIGHLNADFEKSNYYYLMRIKKMLNEEQQTKFQEMIKRSPSKYNKRESKQYKNTDR